MNAPHKLPYLLALLLLACSAPAAYANLVVNGSFEADDFGPSHTLGLVGNDVTGWFIPSSDGTYPWGLENGNTFGATTPFGEQWIVLGRYDTGVEYTIQQTISGLTSGQTYNLSFAIASELNCCSEAEVSFLAGSSTAPQLFVAPASGSFWTVWGIVSMSFVATASDVTLQFKNVNPTTNGFDLGLDNVVVLASTGEIPEPASMLLLGSSLLALAAFRRRRVRAQERRSGHSGSAV